MKKIVFYLPAILHMLFYGLVLLSLGLSASPVVYLWLVFFIISGVLLASGRFWGGAFGLLPGLHLMYMSTVDTGQILPIELPLGILIVAFYLLCSAFVWHEKRKAAK